MYKFSGLIFIVMLFSFAAKAQKVDSIYVHLYTDSLKKGTYNYINVDGLLSNGKYLPLDSTQVRFTCSHGKFFGNSLWLEPDCPAASITITAVLRNNETLRKEFVMYIKRKEDGPLKTQEQVMEEIKAGGKKKKRG